MSTQVKNEVKKEKMFNYIKQRDGLLSAILFFWRRHVQPVVYGLGASIVLLGALCKLTHEPLFGWDVWFCQPNFLLQLGLYVEAFIFLTTIIEKPHMDPDWSRMYPIFNEDYCKVPTENEAPVVVNNTVRNNGTSMGQLESIAKLDEDTIENLKNGINKLSENASKMANISNAFAVTEEYTKNMRNVADKARLLEGQLQSVADLNLNTTMSNYITKVKESENMVADLNGQMKGLKDNMSQLNQVYGNMVSAMKIK